MKIKEVDRVRAVVVVGSKEGSGRNLEFPGRIYRCECDSHPICDRINRDALGAL